jgi:ribonuclease VapC
LPVARDVDRQLVRNDHGPDWHGRPLLLDIFDKTIVELRIDIVPVDLAQGRLAREAFRRFGKGTGHPAKLNFGDCFAYALAKATGRPLLFKGRDFARTDIEPALPTRR